MIPVIVKLCESPGRAGGLPMINYFLLFGFNRFKQCRCIRVWITFFDRILNPPVCRQFAFNCFLQSNYSRPIDAAFPARAI